MQLDNFSEKSNSPDEASESRESASLSDIANNKGPDIANSRQYSDSHTMWDAFEHILLFISLYIFTIFLSLLIHYFIDRWIPKSGRSTSSFYGGNTTIRMYLSAIIVSFPIFAYLFLRVTKRTMENPKLRKLKSRKFLIYTTLVVTFLVSLTTVIIIVYNFLGGNISLNFVAHFLTTLVISGTIFAYYLRQVKEDRQIYA
ncbi:hypothetical protein A2962_05540 [Candidatus Woesebacteria bacterium RIFCSPLOWO2_01_FULL_39_61]|uniref:DUF5671 domain-containing protein n=2 Tax=Microgenomates group TaxID=1794810 RepID=A0A0H4T5D3_9BACT|nr:hypothetical protein [uncultured Microgenomates bacterium Rifle_16ft_4_minimus_37836]OGM28050.1 MAG: hypothetical protein A2692_05280 [Candidatus Woesebacteria bacterium RIFCSPHIGHO2_01_FULL_39_95]OGM34038.1 MAG: hypothetical protein A3D01_03850 [Candidatus Woesebacteria bacterium RIFCSPHIGHO2_02_FULL_39_13]OGM38296.1 MAG: hypothetical protein A3E13_05960 [Candidatus Woesebacteria bacterium RIFCSPHIGHO2_12_FULL_40_20]OGM67759.1 MAG: hypothetical protein A2962_05540 [Candidatus Woesebacteria 